MIYTAPYVMLLTRAYPLRGKQVGGGWALEIETFLGDFNRLYNGIVASIQDP